MANNDSVPAELVIEVDVQATPNFGGNTPDRRYLYSFSPDVSIVRKSSTLMVYQLSKNTREDLVISGIYTNDGRYQIGPPQIAADARSVSFTNRNSQQMLINVMLQVTDRTSNSLIHADPQVLNEPEVPD
ncbi:MAG: hypothetical protein ABI411_05025 [Tahibacter sp.]